jgi:pimeloyl-ACP methyl ester carboxylesterase
MLIEGAGHHPHVEYPDDVAARVLTFDGAARRMPGE